MKTEIQRKHYGMAEISDRQSGKKSKRNPSDSPNIHENNNSDFQSFVRSTLSSLQMAMDTVISQQTSLTKRLSEMESKLSEMKITMNEQGKSLDFIYEEIADTKKSNTSIDRETKELVSKQTTTDSTLKTIQENVNKLERFSRRNNLRLVGCKEDAGDDPDRILQNVLKNKFDMKDVSIETVHRTGKKSENRPRHIIFKVRDYHDKIQILRKKGDSLKDEDFYIIDDLTEEDMKKKRRLRPVMEQAKRENKQVRFRNGSIFINREVI